MVIFSVTVRRNGHRDFDWEKFLLSNAPTHAVWVHDSKIDGPGCPAARSCRIRALVNDVGHDLIARSARDAGALLARASSAARQRGQEDVRGFNRRVRIETHHPCQDLVDRSLLASMRMSRT